MSSVQALHQEYTPEKNTALLLKSCGKCRKPFKGHYYEQECDRCKPQAPTPKVDLKGERRGSLVVKQLAKATHHCVYWRCACDCGRSVIKSEAYLDSRNPTCSDECEA